MIEMVGLDRPEVKPVEKETAARILGSNPYILVSFLSEAGSPSPSGDWEEVTARVNVATLFPLGSAFSTGSAVSRPISST